MTREGYITLLETCYRLQRYGVGVIIIVIFIYLVAKIPRVKN